jgi:excisionase family DNA binding protein
METAPSTVESFGPVYTTRQVAKMLQVSQRSVQVWIREGALPALRYGRLVRIRHADVVAFGQVMPGAGVSQAEETHEG